MRRLLARVKGGAMGRGNMSSQGPFCNVSEEGWNEFAAQARRSLPDTEMPTRNERVLP